MSDQVTQYLLLESQKYDTIHTMEDQILALAKELIEVPSTKENPQALRDVLAVAKKYLKDFTIEEFTDQNIPSLLAYVGSKRPSRFAVILNAHLDVVPAKPEQYKPFVKDGKLFGRGSDDMKAAGAVEILIFAALAKKLRYPIGLQLVTDEETGGFHGTKYQIDKGVRADFVIAGEPTDFGVNNKAKGIVWGKIFTKGKTGHGAYPWNGENALWKMQHILSRLEKTYPIPKKISWETTVNLAKIETNNTTYNKIPDEATAWIDMRYIPEDRNIIEKKLNAIVGQEGTLEIPMIEPAQITDEKNKHVVALQITTKKVIGKKAPVIVKHGGSDIRLFNDVGCDGVTFGPVGAGLHTDTEWVDVGSLKNYYDILTLYLQSL